MTANEILKSLKKDGPNALYFMHGEEPYFVDKIIVEIQKKAIPAAEKGFNEFILYGKEINIGVLLSYARRFPMMADRQLIIVKDAQLMQGIEQKENQKLIEDYALNPLGSTILVLAFATPQDERRTWVKSFGKQGVLQNFKKLYDNQIPEFIADYCHTNGVKISLKAIQLIVEHIGNDLKRITAEIDKVILNLGLGEEINAQIVEKYIGISKEYNVFELQKAFIQRDVLKANMIINYFAANTKDNPIQPILIILFNFFSKLLMVHSSADKSEKNLATMLNVHTFFVKDYLMAARNYNYQKNISIIHYLKKADLFSKGVEAGEMTDGDILRQLIFEILH